MLKIAIGEISSPNFKLKCIRNPYLEISQNIFSAVLSPICYEQGQYIEKTLKILYNSFVEKIRFKMLPIVTPEQAALCFAEIFQDVHSWRKKMIHYIKDENPEINSAVIEAAQNTDLDPKAVALGAYMAYILLETAMKEETGENVYTAGGM